MHVYVHALWHGTQLFECVSVLGKLQSLKQRLKAGRRVDTSGGAWHGEPFALSSLPVLSLFQHACTTACPKQVLTNLVHNGTYHDPNLGAVNLHIPDVFHAGRCFYTYWFSTNFSVPLNATAGQRARLTFHGINYSAR